MEAYPGISVHYEGEASWEVAQMIGCLADLDRDGALTLFDFMKFQSLFESGDPRADVNHDGHIDLFDRLEALRLGMGCW